MHRYLMRTHASIVNAAGADQVANRRGVSIHTARSWAQRDSIPAEHWQPFVTEGWATLEELAAHAARNPRRTADTAAAA